MQSLWSRFLQALNRVPQFQRIQRLRREIEAFAQQQRQLRRYPDARPGLLIPANLWQGAPNRRLLELTAAALPLTMDVDHSDIAARMTEFPHWPQIWPGEHYKLLSGLVRLLKPGLIVEIGTATGYSALAMQKFLEPGSRLVTFDLVSWRQFPHCVLTEADFAAGNLEQILSDLSDWNQMERHRELLEQADLVFIDAAKDGHQEQRFIDNFSRLRFARAPIFLFDDVKLLNMVDIWQRLDRPKLDISSIGHWAGSGLVDWTASS